MFRCWKRVGIDWVPRTETREWMAETLDDWIEWVLLDQRSGGFFFFFVQKVSEHWTFFVVGRSRMTADTVCAFCGFRSCLGEFIGAELKTAFYASTSTITVVRHARPDFCRYRDSEENRLAFSDIVISKLSRRFM